MLADGSTINQAVAVPADRHDQGTLDLTGAPLVFLSAACAGCGLTACLSGPGRHQCRRCNLWLLYVPREVTTCLKTS